MSESQKVGGIRIIPDTDQSGVNSVDFASKNNGAVVGLAAPDVLGGNLLFRLPAADGLNGQAIVTNGSGILSFAAAGTIVAAPGNDSQVIFNSGGIAGAGGVLAANAGFTYDAANVRLKVNGWITGAKIFATQGFIVYDIDTPTNAYSLSSGGNLLQLNCSFAPGGAANVMTIDSAGHLAAGLLDSTGTGSGLLLRDRNTPANWFGLYSSASLLRFWANFGPMGVSDIASVDSAGQITSNATAGGNAFRTAGNDFRVTGDGNLYAKNLTSAQNAYVTDLVIRDTDTQANTWQLYSTANIFRIYAGFNATTNLLKIDSISGYSTFFGSVQARTLIADYPAGSGKGLSVASSGSPRWFMGGNSDAETGSPVNTGTNFVIYRLSDAGNLIDTPISINRATGIVSIPNLSVGTLVAPGFNSYVIFNVSGSYGANANFSYDSAASILKILSTGATSGVAAQVFNSTATGAGNPAFAIAGTSWGLTADGTGTFGTAWVSNGLVLRDVNTPANQFSLASVGNVFRLNSNFTSTGARDVVFVDGVTGDVGIGVLADATAFLQVAATVGGRSSIRTGAYEVISAGALSGANITDNAYWLGAGLGWAYRASGPAELISMGNGFTLYTAVSGTAGAAVSWIAALSITTSGLVTIPNLSLQGGSLTAGTVFLNNGLVIKDVQTPSHMWSLSSQSDVFRLNCNFTSGGAADVLKVDSSGKTTIGITAASPIAQLYVVSPANSTSAAFTDAANSTLNIIHASSPLNNSLIYATFGSASQIWQVNSVNAMCLINTGKVGIGTMAPVSPLEVVGVAGTSSIKTGSLEIQSSALNYSNVMDNAYYTGSQYLYRGTGAATLIQLLSGGLVVYVAASGTAGAAVTWLAAMTIASTGVVSIPNLVLSGSITVGTMFLNNGLVIKDVQTPSHQWSLASTSDIFRLNCNFTSGGAADVFVINAAGQVTSRAAGTNVAFSNVDGSATILANGAIGGQSLTVSQGVGTLKVFVGIYPANVAANVTGAGMFYDTTNNVLRIEAITQSVAWRNVCLCPSAGYVGIGLLAPVSALEVAAPTTTSGIKTGGLELQSYTIENGWISTNIFYNNGWFYRAAGVGCLMYLTGGGFTFYSVASGAAGAAAGITPVMAIVSSGLVTCYNSVTNNVTGGTNAFLTSNNAFRATGDGNVYCSALTVAGGAITLNSTASTFATVYTNNGFVCKDVQTPSRNYSLSSTSSVFRISANFGVGGAVDYFTVDATTGAVTATYFYKCGIYTGVSGETVTTSAGSRPIRGGIICSS